MNKLIPIIGLEVHTELKTKSKMFCDCPNDPFVKEPNLYVCPVCMAHPGTLPVINEQAVRAVLKVGLALNCKIVKLASFDRKSYFYPDLPKGYQISQYKEPLCGPGYLVLPESGEKIQITRVHLEEDTGKLVHDQDPNSSLVDYNRAGVPLMELVTEPDLRSAAQARAFAQELRLVLLYLGVSDADMEKGQLRLEANISLGQELNGKLQSGTKVEVKNLNSFMAMERAIDYELKRQAEVLSSAEKVVQETRGWDDAKQITFAQRGKEGAEDYRYLPEPDLPPLQFSKEYLRGIAAELPELPAQKRKRFSKEYGLVARDILILTANLPLANYFEQICSELKAQLKVTKTAFQLAANYLLSDWQGLLRDRKLENLEQAIAKISAENFAEFIGLLVKGEISSKIAKTILVKMFEQGADPSQLIADSGLTLLDNDEELLKLAEPLLKANPKAIADFKQGKAQALQFLIGQLMKATKGRAEPQKAKEVLTKLLNKS